MDQTNQSAPAHPIAVVIQGDERYLGLVDVVPLAEEFYCEIADLLTAKGYQVEFDRGRRYEYPNRQAALWVAHDTGATRLRHAKPSTTCMVLQTLATSAMFASRETRCKSREHYSLSAKDRQAIAALPGRATKK